MDDFVILIDGSGQYGSVVEDSADLNVSPGPHIFVLRGATWFECVVAYRPGRMPVTFSPVRDSRLVGGLMSIWRSAHKPKKSNQDVDALSLLLTLDAIGAGAREHFRERKNDIDREEGQRREVESAHDFRSSQDAQSTSSLDKIDEVLGRAKADLEFIEHLLEHGTHVHHALHLIAIGDPTGIFSLLSLVFSAMGQTFVQDHDVESLAVDLLKQFGRAPVRITAEIFDGTQTVLQLRDLADQDVSLWMRFEPRAPILEQEREFEPPSIKEDLGLSL